jgi:hypothetical protein
MISKIEGNAFREEFVKTLEVQLFNAFVEIDESRSPVKREERLESFSYSVTNAR